MKLMVLKLRNFKGIKSFELDANGSNVSIYGDNATGKTTVFDACNWLLFDKDSQNKKDFQIKTLDASGNAIHHLEHEVEGVFDIGIRPVTLKKMLAEKWTKKRGAATEEFTGHETKYWIDGVPKPKKEYDAFITSILDENIFKLLTNPSYFNEQLHWQDRRKILLEICGDITDEEVIASDKKLAELPKILQGRTLDDHRKVIQSRQAAINRELKEIPARINEVQRGLPDISNIFNREVIETEIASLKKQQQAKQQEIVRVENGGEVAEKQKALSVIEGRLIDIQNKHRAANQDKSFAKRLELQDLKSKMAIITSHIADKEAAISRNDDLITAKLADCETLRNRWHEVYERKFEYSADTVCPTCGQDLPESQVEAAREKALSTFNLSKSKMLEDISADGKKAKKDSEDLKAKNAALQSEIDSLVNEKASIERSISALQAEIDNMATTPAQSIDSYPGYQAAINEKESILKQIAAISTEKQGVIRQLQSEVDIIAQDIASRERSIAQLDAHARSLKRIDELKAQEEMLSAEFEKLTSELYLTEQFIRAKVNMLESRINSKFKYARFKLFNQQVNGGIEEVCETTFKGVPYSSGLNNAARINVGLDIINTLSEHYGFLAPIFVDNREAVTQLIETKAQVISLIVSAADKTLRIEYEDQGGCLK